MRVYDIYSKRNGLRKVHHDVFQYTEFSEEFRNQVVFIWKDTIGIYHEANEYDYDDYDSPSNQHWIDIHDILAREYGRLECGRSTGTDVAKV